MKTILILFLFACCLSADKPVIVPLADKTPGLIFKTSTADAGAPWSLETTHPSHLSIVCGSVVIILNLKTGHADLPRGIPLDKAAISFWHKVADSFADFRAQVIGDALKEKDAIIARQAEQIQHDNEVMMPPVTGPLTPPTNGTSYICSAPPLTTMWGDDWLKQHPSKYVGRMAFVEIRIVGDDGKAFRVELGLRSDGVVVWREIKP